ncbi:hypothetical protein H6F97_16875 [Microcoleus sp. FACHB-1]|nr:hypothetical protein [Microcoleus sp. FACHB-1]
MLYPCPCCGYMTLNQEPPGTYIICPICFWEDDAEQSYSSNRVSLRQAQRNFIEFGACESEWLKDVRHPTCNDQRAPGWETIDTLAEKTRLLLIEKITAAFDGVSRQDGISLHAAQALDDYSSLEEAKKIGREMDRDTQGQDVPDKWLMQFQDIFPYLDPKGFRYYIPAYMVWSLKEPKASDSNSLSSLMWAIENNNKHFQPHLEILNQEQLQVVSDYIEFVNNYIYFKLKWIF